jgi:MOSC domain-containing protein YiiM
MKSKMETGNKREVVASITSIQVGKPELREENSPFTGERSAWTTGFYKLPVIGEVYVDESNIAGDGQADLRYHGGPDKAVCVYATEHYPYWRETLGIADIGFGAFGENLSVEGLNEESVCLGDTWVAGGVHFQVSQPRQPCWKLARRWAVKNFAQLVEDRGYTGWYFRVVKKGTLSKGTPLTLLQRPLPEWTVTRTNQVMYREPENLEAARRLSECPLLSNSWRRVFAGRAASSTV